MKFVALLTLAAMVEAGRREKRERTRKRWSAESFLAMLDEDEDGTVTEAEVEALFDTKCVHYLEHKNMWIETPLTDDEIIATCAEKWDELWALLDTDASGTLELEELEDHGKIHFWA